MGTKMGIQLLADNKLIALPDSLEQAKKLAEPYIIEKREIKIECSASPAPMRNWIYDYKERDWVEQIGLG